MSSAHTHRTHSHVSYQRRLLRLPEVMLRTGYKRSHIYNLMRRGDFPTTVKLGTRAVAWDSVEIDMWISERLESRALPYPATAAIH